jgi:NhaP-type Na+/H+ or K+/H+ antiporter
MRCVAAHHGHTELLVVFFPFFSLLIGCLVRLASVQMSWLPLPPYTVSLLLVGIIIGAIITETHPHNDLAHSAIIMAGIDPHLMLFIFLPPLLFESAYSIKWHVFRKTAGAAVLLATSGVVIATLITAGCVSSFLYPDWDWNVCVLLGCILSATDPVAVVALLKDLGAKESLSTMIEGESLLNDGTAVVLFVVLLEAVQVGYMPYEWYEIIGIFAKMAIGGPLWGMAMSGATSSFVARIHGDVMTEVTLTIVGSYLTFFIGEYYFQVSGVLAIVAYGLYFGHFGRANISTEVEEVLEEFWETFAFIANTLVFVMAGIILPMKAFDKNYIELKDLVKLFAIYFAIHFARAVVVRTHLPIINKLGYKFSLADATLSWWGGLRGAVGLALALVVALDGKIADHGDDMKQAAHLILFHVAGIVALTLLINATTMSRLLRFFQLHKVPVSKEENFLFACQRLQQRGTETVNQIRNDDSLRCALWHEVSSYQFAIEPAEVCQDIVRKKVAQSFFEQWSEDQQVDQGQELGGPKAVPTSSEFYNRLLGHESEPERKKRRLEAKYKETVRRFLLIVNASYWEQFRSGMLSKSAVRKLTQATDNCIDSEVYGVRHAAWRKHEKELEKRRTGGGRLDAAEGQGAASTGWFWAEVGAGEGSIDCSGELCEWEELRSCLQEQSTAMKDHAETGCAPTAKMARSLVYQQLELGCDVAQGFLAAREEALHVMAGNLDDTDVDEGDGDDVFEALREAANAYNSEINSKLMSLQTQNPEEYAAIHTQHVSRSVLKAQQHMVLELYEEGFIDDTEQQRLSGAVLTQKLQLLQDYGVLPILDKMHTLRNVPWLSGLGEDALEELAKGVTIQTFGKRDVLVSDTAVMVTGGEHAGKRGEPWIEEESIDLYAREGGKNNLRLADSVKGVFVADRMYEIALIEDPKRVAGEYDEGEDGASISDRPVRDGDGNQVVVQVAGRHLKMDDRHAGEVFIVARGTVNVVVPVLEPRLDEDRVEVRAILPMGSTFGEIGWLTHKQPTAKVRSIHS